MKKLIEKLLPALALLWPLITWAVRDTRITVQGSNVILSWPSWSTEHFVVQYRTNLNPQTAWVTLANNLPGQANTNRTSFTHVGAATFTACSGGGSGGPSGGPPTPSSSSLMASGDGSTSSHSARSSLRVAGVAGPVEATTERGRYYDGPAPQVRRGAARRLKLEEPPFPPGPEEMARQRQERAHNGGGEVMLLSGGA